MPGDDKNKSFFNSTLFRVSVLETLSPGLGGAYLAGQGIAAFAAITIVGGVVAYNASSSYVASKVDNVANTYFVPAAQKALKQNPDVGTTPSNNAVLIKPDWAMSWSSKFKSSIKAASLHDKTRYLIAQVTDRTESDTGNDRSICVKFDVAPDQNICATVPMSAQFVTARDVAARAAAEATRQATIAADNNFNAAATQAVQNNPDAEDSLAIPVDPSWADKMSPDLKSRVDTSSGLPQITAQITGRSEQNSAVGRYICERLNVTGSQNICVTKPYTFFDNAAAEALAQQPNIAVGNRLSFIVPRADLTDQQKRQYAPQDFGASFTNFLAEQVGGKGIGIEVPITSVQSQMTDSGRQICVALQGLPSTQRICAIIPSASTGSTAAAPMNG